MNLYEDQPKSPVPEDQKFGCEKSKIANMKINKRNNFGIGELPATTNLGVGCNNWDYFDNFVASQSASKFYWVKKLDRLKANYELMNEKQSQVKDDDLKFNEVSVMKIQDKKVYNGIQRKSGMRILN